MSFVETKGHTNDIYLWASWISSSLSWSMLILQLVAENERMHVANEETNVGSYDLHCYNL